MRRQLCPAVSYGSAGEIDMIHKLFEPFRQHFKTKRYIVVSKANELCFYTTVDDENKSVLIGGKSHRFSIHGSAKNGSKIRRNDHGLVPSFFSTSTN